MQCLFLTNTMKIEVKYDSPFLPFGTKEEFALFKKIRKSWIFQLNVIASKFCEGSDGKSIFPKLISHVESYAKVIGNATSIREARAEHKDLIETLNRTLRQPLEHNSIESTSLVENDRRSDQPSICVDDFEPMQAIESVPSLARLRGQLV